MSDTVKVCPMCESSSWKNQRTSHASDPDHEPYYCSDCNSRFNSPKVKPREVNGDYNGPRVVDDDELQAAKNALEIDK